MKNKIRMKNKDTSIATLMRAPKWEIKNYMTHKANYTIMAANASMPLPILSQAEILNDNPETLFA